VTEQYIVWALIVGVAIGAALYWFAVGRLPRRTDDLTAAERDAEARWVSRTIEARGGVAPVDLVDEVLDLHSAYLAGPAMEPEEFDATPVSVAPSVPRTRLRDEPRSS
jgi:HAMP domain-containing protein